MGISFGSSEEGFDVYVAHAGIRVCYAGLG